MQPNLLFLYSDEQRWDTLACTGNRRIAMPNLNRLAEQSTLVEQTYVTQPVCTPARASLLTGLWPHQCAMERTNVILDEAYACLPEMLEPGCWRTAHQGKWHMGDELFAQHGFEEWIASEDTYHDFCRPHRDPTTHSQYDAFLRAHGCRPRTTSIKGREPWVADRFFRKEIHAMPEELSRPMFLANSARRFIREQSDQPWALYVSILEPHMPFHSCRDHQYDPDSVPLPPHNAMQAPARDHARRAQLAAAGYRIQGYDGDGPYSDEASWRRLIARYWGMCSLVDEAIGRILAQLEESGQMDNTIIVFTSDHGDMMGSHGLLAKGYQYEEAARVPLLVKLPGQQRSRRVTGPMSHIDVVPTLLDAMGQQVPAYLPGQSRLQLMRQGGHCSDDVVIEWNGAWRGNDKPLPAWAEEVPGTEEQIRASIKQDIRSLVTADGWKYNHSSVGEHELFCLREDPGELCNRIADPAQAERISEYRRRLSKWQQATQDHHQPVLS